MDSKNKQEIIQSFPENAGYDGGWSEDQIISMMDRWAEQQAIAFADFCGNYGEYHKEEWRGNVMMAEPIYTTTTEMYKLFLHNQMYEKLSK